MQSLLHSPFLQALGYSIINSLWQFAFLWLLYFFINSVFRLSSHQKYVTGLVLEVAGFSWFLVTLSFYYNQSQLLPQSNLSNEIVLSALATNNVTSLKQQFFLVVLHSERYFPFLSIAYLALLFILTMRWIYAYKFTKVVRIAGLQAIDKDWKTFVEEMSVRLGIQRTIYIFLSEIVHTPLTIGFFKPIILIPVATINYLSQEQLEAVILHEMAHIKRFDYLFNLVLALIEACLFFNPFMQLIHQQVRKERENCCDDWVLKYNYTAASYARALLQIASNQCKKPLLALHATDNKKALITRIKRIIEKKEKTFFNHRYQLFALLVLTTLLSALSFLSPRNNLKLKSTLKITGNVVFEPMAAKVTNPLFNPIFFLANKGKSVAELLKKPLETRSVKTKIVVGPMVEQFAGPKYDYIQVLPGLPALLNEKDEFSGSLVQPLSSFIPTPGFTSKSDQHQNQETVSRENERHIKELKSEIFYPGEIPRQVELAETHVRNYKKGVVQDKKVIFKLEKLKDEANDLPPQYRFYNKKINIGNMEVLVRDGIRKLKNEESAAVPEKMSISKINVLQQLADEFDHEIDVEDYLRFHTTNFNFDDGYIQRPTIVNHIPEDQPHNFSFEYSIRPTSEVLLVPAIQQLHKEQQQKHYLIINVAEETDAEDFAPPAPSRDNKRRFLKIIKI